MATTVFDPNLLNNTHRRFFIMGTGASLLVLAVIGLLFTSLYAPFLPPFIFWMSISWLTILVLTAWAVFALRLNSTIETPRTLNSKLYLKPGATTIALVYALVSAGLVILIAESYRAGAMTVVMFSIVAQILMFSFVIALIVLRFAKLVPGLPPQAISEAQANIATLQSRLDELELLRNEPWMEGLKGNTPLNRLRCAMLWWREELATTMPQRGLEMAQPFIAYFLDNVGRDTNFIQDLAYSERPVTEDQIVEAEQRVLEGINRTGQIVRKLRQR